MSSTTSSTIALTTQPTYPTHRRPSQTPSTTTLPPDPPSNPDSTIPDGGYGWVITFSCALITFWFVGTSYCWGVIQAALVSEGVGSAASLSFVGALTATCIAVFAIVNAKVLRIIGAQRTALLGVTLLGLGGVASGWAVKRFEALLVTTGIVSGLGTSLCFMTVSTVPAQYFLRKRGLVNGIVYAGGGLGGAILSLTMARLVSSYGPAWTFRIIGLATLLTGLPAAYLIRERAPPSRRNFVEWNLFRSLKFVLLFGAGTIATFPLFVPPFFLPLFATSIGLSAELGAGMLAAFNFSSAVGRIGFGLFGDLLGPLNALFVSLLLSALSMLAIWPVSSSLAPLVVFVIVNGVGNGGFFAIVPTVVASVFGSNRMAVAMSMIVTGWAGGYLMGGPIAGYLLQAYGGEKAGIAAYRPAMYYSGSMSMAAAGLVAFVRFRIDGRVMARV